KNDIIKEGDIVKGRVIHVGKDHVVVDIGYKSEGTIPLYEFTHADATVSVKEGDEIDVFLETREDENGLCVLSKEKADRLKVWDEISGACERDELIEGTISARVKGGLSVTIRGGRSEEHTSELQSRGHLVCRLLLEKKNRARL